jgi:hypothetical protein
MKKYYALVSILFFIILSLTSCKNQSPEVLTFGDIYGRESWEIEAEDNGGYFEVKKSSDVTVNEIANSGAVYKSYQMTTTGTKPSITTQRILVASSGKILTFKYKVSEDIDPIVCLDITNDGSTTKMWTMQKANEWKEYTFDLGTVISNSSWGGVGSYVKLIFGEKAGVNIEIKDIQIRARTEAEQKTEDSFIFQFANRAPNQMKNFEIQTEIKTTTGNAYMFVPIANANDCNMQTEPRYKTITSTDNQLYFEYKCATSFGIRMYWLVRGGDETNGDSFPAATEWTKAHIDWSDVITNKIFVNYPNAGAQGNVMRFDIYGISDSTPLYIRGMRLEKK